MPKIQDCINIKQDNIYDPNLKELDASNNINITDVSFLKKLQKLNTNGYFSIDQKGINNLNLVELYARNNKNIVDLSFMVNLQKLDASGNSGIGQNWYLKE